MRRVEKIIFVIAGAIISAYGITMAINAGFGGATLAVLWQGVSHTFGSSIGLSSFIVAVGMILFAAVYDIHQIYFGTIIYQIVYSGCVDLFAKIQYRSQWIILNFILMLIGIIIFAVGTGIYASADYGRGSYEAVTFALVSKNHWQVRTVRMVLDTAVVIAGVLLGGKFGSCTICTIIMSGPIIQWTVHKIEKRKYKS